MTTMSIQSSLEALPGRIRALIIGLSGVMTGYTLDAQTITRAEYFFDNDPGVGNGVRINVPIPADEVTFTETINTSGLNPGYHILFIRTKSSDHLWSLYEQREFVIEAPIDEAEYFFDVDPGVGSGNPFAVGSGVQSFISTISTAGLADGEHVLFLRTRQGGEWSLSEPIAFYIKTRIVAAEYFIDTDPGLGNGTPIPINSPSHDLTVNTAITPPVLSAGTHYLFVRTQDISGSWSLYEGQEFTVDLALPVELEWLTATVTQERNVVVSWRTATERNSKHFLVLHADKSLDFSEIARVAAHGDSKIPRHYSAVDYHPVSGNNYYRLTITDIDGRTELSKIAVARVPNGTGPVVYPNPIVNNWVIDFTDYEEKEAVTIEVFDTNGRLEKSFTSDGEGIIKMTNESLASGMHILKISSRSKTDIFKIVVR